VTHRIVNFNCRTRNYRARRIKYSCVDRSRTPQPIVHKRTSPPPGKSKPESPVATFDKPPACFLHKIMESSHENGALEARGPTPSNGETYGLGIPFDSLEMRSGKRSKKTDSQKKTNRSPAGLILRRMEGDECIRQRRSRRFSTYRPASRNNASTQAQPVWLFIELSDLQY
jgi:hypothetical protein